MSPAATDGTLAHEASGGDERALGRIFREFHQPLYRYCLAILGNRQDAEDALQETMVKVLRALPGEKRTIALKPWLYRIAHNESIDLLRRRRASVSLEESEPVAGEGLAEQVQTRLRLRQLIVDLEALPERQRGALLMREAGGLDFEEIGAALGTSAAVARQTLYEARLGLRQMNAGHEMDCAVVTEALSGGDRRIWRRRDIRAHLRDCADCRRFAEEIDSRRGDLAAISPLPAVAAAALLHGVLGGGAGGGVGGLLSASAAKSVGTATLLKGAAAVGVVAAIGVGAADRGGLIHIGGHDPAPAARSGVEPGGASASPEATPAPAGSKRDSASRRSAQPSLQSSIGTRSDTGTAQPASPATDDAAPKGTESAPQSPPADDSDEGEVASTPPGKSGVEHPHGRGHAKQTPAAAAHGQETAAGHEPESGADGSAGSKSASSSHPAHPDHPTHPAESEESAEPSEPSESAEPNGPPPAADPPATKPEGKGPK